MSDRDVGVLQNELISWISSLKDPHILELLSSIKSLDSEKADWWDGLNFEQRRNIEAELEDLKQNRLKSSKEFWKSLENE